MCPCFSRSTEEVIALFISIAFVVDAVKGTVKSKTRVSFLVYITVLTVAHWFSRGLVLQRYWTFWLREKRELVVSCD